MEQLYATHSISMAEFRVNPESFIDDPDFQVIAVQRDNGSNFYVVKAEVYEAMQKHIQSMKG